MPGTVARDAPWKDFPPLGHIAAQTAGFFVVDPIDLIDAKRADLPSASTASISSHFFASKPL
jgi:hypothetical protein